MSVLLVACPCAIGLATPVVIWSALNRLAERGVIVSGGDVVERLAAVDRVMFDKTGTLTDDRFALLEIETVSDGPERAKLLGWLSLIQAQSNHPVAKPFGELPRPFAPGAEPRVAALRAVPGCGVVAELVEADGVRREVRVGVPEWVAADLPPQPPFLKGRGSKAVYVSVDGEVAVVATVAERVRESTSAALAGFARLGLPVEVLTGDAPGRAEALGLPSPRGGLLPDDKRAAVERAKADGAKPLFVGDGINDASALAAAHVGVALASGADLAVSAAPVTLYGGDLAALPWAVDLSRDAVRAVRRNLARAVAYNLVGVALAACGVLHPVVAAVLMVVSSLTLVFSASRVGCGHAEGEDPPPNPLPAGRGSQQLVDSYRDARAQDARGSVTPLPAGRGAGGGGPTVAHAFAFALQGAAFLLLLAPLREPLSAALVLGAFALAGAALAFAWRRCAVPHWVDMCVGMLTLGNLGMLLGWWADNHFASLSGHACCACAQGERPWMWVGMLLFANAAMRWLGKGPPPGREHVVAMFTGGNAGMVLGMLAGGWLAGQVPAPGAVAAAALAFAAMTLVMLAGMLVGTWLAERLLVGLRAVGFWPRLRATRTS